MWTRLETVAALAASLGLTLSLVGTIPASRAAQPADQPPQVSYAEDIAPIFEESCVQCHGAEKDGEVRKEALLDLTSYEALMAGSEFGSVVEPGDPDNSMIVVLIEDGDMPEDGDPLPAEQIEKIRTWIAEGAENN